MEKRNQTFQERRDVVVKGLRDIRLEVESPKATFYVWSTIPKGYTSKDFCFKVLEEANVWVIPGRCTENTGKGTCALL